MMDDSIFNIYLTYACANLNNAMPSGLATWILLFLAPCCLVLCQGDVECLSPGECLDSDLLTVVPAESFNECLEECRDYETGDGRTCQDYTFYTIERVSPPVCRDWTILPLEKQVKDTITDLRRGI